LVSLIAAAAIMLLLFGAVAGAQSPDLIFLAQGWNLISLPVQPANTAMASALSGISGSYDVVWGYPNQSWSYYDPNDPSGSTLPTMEAGNGYWIYMTVPWNLSVSGSAPSSSLSLLSGWNLIGYGGASCADVSSILSPISSRLPVLWGYQDRAWKVYDPKDAQGSTLTQLCPGLGYWLKVSEATTCTLPIYEWTWESGSNLPDQAGVYGTRGIAEAPNLPGARFGSVSWADANGNLWLFGGYNEAGNHLFNDLWKFDGANWTWVSGSTKIDQKGVYGTKSTAAPGNVPGARALGVSWTDKQGNLWLFGGFGYDSAGQCDGLNDLWKFDGTSWTWVSGSNTVDRLGVYGTKGEADTANVPGARVGSVSWTDLQGDLWLFGGAGYYSAGNGGDFNDLWKFDGTSWTWVSGSNTVEAPGSYGKKGIAAPGNAPGARDSAVSWTDKQGNLWLFGGGLFQDSAGIWVALNDLWKFDGSNWTWVSGSDTVGQAGAYGTKGLAARGNVPGARLFAASWTDLQGNLWLFGGGYYGSAGQSEGLNDLWKFDGSNWTWVSGSDKVDQAGAYGTNGLASPGNVPGTRLYASSWTDLQGNLWLFGGAGIASAGNAGALNDLWRYGP
jgi:N-acetylneuraminic acid mutarotase